MEPKQTQASDLLQTTICGICPQCNKFPVLRREFFRRFSPTTVAGQFWNYTSQQVGSGREPLELFTKFKALHDAFSGSSSRSGLQGLAVAWVTGKSGLYLSFWGCLHQIWTSGAVFPLCVLEVGVPHMEHVQRSAIPTVP